MNKIKNRKNLVSLRLCAFALSFLVASTLLIAISLSQNAQAQLLAYEGFDYPTGNLLEVAGDGLGGGTGWTTADQSIPAMGEDPATDVFGGWYEHATDNDPARAVVEANPANWGYTDSQGNSLQTTGRVLNHKNWHQVTRQIDLSGLDPSELVQTKPGREQLGVDGTEYWISFLGQGGGVTSSAPDRSNFDLGGLHTNNENPGFSREMALGRPFTLQADGTTIENGDNDAWGIIDRERTAGDTTAYAATGHVATEKVFYVAKMRFGAGPEFDGKKDILFDVWINPDLGATAPSGADRKVSDFVVWHFKDVPGDVRGFGAIRFDGNTDTWYDEIRIGRTYADVAPIAAPSGGADFDGDGDVDGADFLKWQTDLAGAADLANWKSEYGTTSGLAAATGVPEPSSLLLLGGSLLGLAMRRRAKREGGW